MQYKDGRPCITLRKCDSDERGLFLSLPIAELYGFVKDDDNKLEMVVEGHKNLGISEKVYFILDYSLGDFCFIHQGVLKREILLV